MTNRLVAVALVAVAHVLTACSGVGVQTGADERKLADKALQITQEGRQAIQEYLALAQQPPAETIAAWDAFLAKNGQAIARVRSLYPGWRAALQEAVDAGVVDLGNVTVAELREYLALAEQWTSDREEELHLGKQCLSTATGDFDRFLACYGDAIRPRAAGWQATADRLNALSAKIGFSD